MKFLIFLSLISFSGLTLAESTVKQQNAAIKEVLNYLEKKGIAPHQINYYDEHDYDGDLSSIEYEVDFYKDGKKCTQVIAVEAYPEISPVEDDHTEGPDCL